MSMGHETGARIGGTIEMHVEGKRDTVDTTCMWKAVKEHAGTVAVNLQLYGDECKDTRQ